MKKKLGMKLCSISLVLVMVVSLFSGMFTFSASAATGTIDPSTVTSYSVWDGSSTDTSWTSAGTKAYYITSAAELAGLAYAVNEGTTYSGYTFYITAHIDLGKYEWTPIGKYNAGSLIFAGKLIGAYNKTVGSDVVIKNMKITTAPQVNYGLIGSYSGSEVSSITLLDPVVSGALNTAGFFVGYGKTNAKTFSDLAVVNGTMNISGTSSSKWVGGIAAYTNGVNVTFSNCSVDAKINVEGHKYVGGFVGQANKTVKFENCKSLAEITASSSPVGGFLGYIPNGTLTFTGCYSGVNINSEEKRAAGFVGELGALGTSTVTTFTRCQFDGLVTSSGTQSGAFVGRLQAGTTNGNNALTFDSCVNTGISINSVGISRGGVSWIGLVAGNSYGATYLDLTIKNTTCYSATNAGIAPINDKLDLTVNLTYGSGSSTKTVSCSSSTEALGAYDDPTLLSSVSNMSSTFTTANGWSINGSKPVLTIAADIDDPYAEADLSWLDIDRAVATDDASPVPYSKATIDTTEKYIGLAKVSHLSGALLTNCDFVIDWTKIDTVKATDDLFAEDFELVLNEKATYTAKINGASVDSNVFSVALQTRAGDTDGYYDVRFLSGVNSLADYENVGFEITRNDTGAKLTLSTTQVYTSIKGADVVYTPADTVSDDATHFYAVVVDNIAADMSITVQAFATLTDGTKIYGKAQKGTVGNTSNQTKTALDTVAGEYQIVYAEGNSETREVALALRDYIEIATGARMPVVTDTAANKNASVTKDILVGATSRISDEPTSLDYYGMMIKRTDDKILLVGGSDVAYKQAYIHLADMLEASATVDGVSWATYASGDDSWAISTITGGAESYLSSFTPAWAPSTWSYTTNYKKSWISDFEEKTAAMLQGGRVTSKAHRGDITNYPDCSIEGIASSILAGVDAVEFDVHITLDGVPVLMHNATLNGTTNVEDYVGCEGYPNSTYVCDWTYTQLKDLCLTDGSGAVTSCKIATLYEALKLCAGRVFVQIDDKTHNLTGGSVGVINDSDTVYDLATAADARETLMHYYYNERVYEGSYNVNQATYTDVYKNWIETYDIRNSTDADDIAFVSYIEWCERLGTNNIKQSKWPLRGEDDTLAETEAQWNTMLGKGYTSFWTENPYLLCTWIQANYTAVAANITPANSDLTAYSYGTGDTYNFDSVFGDGNSCVTCVDELPKDAICDVCGNDVPCTACVDQNPRDAICDVCGGTITYGADDLMEINSEYRVLISSDQHFTYRNNWYNVTPEDRLQMWVDAVLEEHARRPFDLIILNGDYSLDYWGSGGSVLKDGICTTEQFVDRYVSQIRDAMPDVPVFVLPGNHDAFKDDTWYEMTGNHRQETFKLGNNVFVMMDSYATNLEPSTEPSGGAKFLSPMDTEYLQEQINNYPGCNFYLVTHHFGFNNDDNADFREVIAANDNIVALFQGHEHKTDVVDLGETYNNKKIFNTGNFSYTEVSNIYDCFWGFRDLLILKDKAHSRYIIANSTAYVNGKWRDFTRTTNAASDIAYPN